MRGELKGQYRGRKPDAGAYCRDQDDMMGTINVLVLYGSHRGNANSRDRMVKDNDWNHN